MIEPRCKHNWTTPPECPQCCADERDQLKEKIERADEWRKMSESEYTELEKERDQLRQQLEAAQTVLKEEKQWSEDLAKQCCEMEDALGFRQDQHGPKGEFIPTIRPWKERVRDLIAKEAELSEKQGWVSPEKVKALVEAGDSMKSLARWEGSSRPTIAAWDSAKKDL